MSYLGSQPHLESLALRARLDADAAYNQGVSDTVAQWSPALEQWKAYGAEWRARAERAEQEAERLKKDLQKVDEVAVQKLDGWVNYANKLKEQNTSWEARHKELQQLNDGLRDALAQTRAELEAERAQNAEQAQLQQRNLVFIEVLGEVLKRVTGNDYPFGGEIRHVFKSTYTAEIDAAISSGRLPMSPERDPAFAKAYPGPQRLVASILQQAKQDSEAMSLHTGYEPDDNLP